MDIQSKARELAKSIEIVMSQARCADKKSARLCESISQQEVRVLLILGRGGPTSMCEIADAVGLSMSSVTGLVDKLEEKKLVRRERSTDDRRIVRVELTEPGRETHTVAMEGQIEFARGLLEALAASEQEDLLALFRKLAAKLSRKESQKAGV